MRELNGLGDLPGEVVLAVAKERFHKGERYVFVLFTDIRRKTHGKRLAAYIKKNKLGKIINTSTRQNPNTGNSLKAWIWAINHGKLEKFWQKNKPSEESLEENWTY